MFCIIQREEMNELKELHTSIVRNLVGGYGEPNRCFFKDNSILKLTGVYRYSVCIYV